MSIKLPWTLKSNDKNPEDKVNKNFETVYKVKLESVKSRRSSGVTSYIYQVLETGKTTDYSANGSAAMAVSFGFAEKHGTIIYAEAHATNPYIKATVTDITQTGLSITFVALGNTADNTAANISTVVTGTWSAYYMAIFSDA